jgi:uncharacterized protein YkwD
MVHARGDTFRAPRDVLDVEASAITSLASSADTAVVLFREPPTAHVPEAPSRSPSEIRMLALINDSRGRAGLVPLADDTRVAATARAHSAAEAEAGYVYHDGVDGSAKARDAAACGTGWFGENTGKIWNDNVDALHVEFMTEAWSPINHRTNIMDPAFRRAGIGAVIGRDAMYMTMVFCR